MKYARVIVDVPSIDTDRPFDYEIPEKLLPFTHVGSRVAVPFGPRKLQGFVTEIRGETEVEKTREILEVLDPIPPLNEELIRLADWMSEHYLCPRITALQAMLPAVLKSKYRKIVRLHASRIPEMTAMVPEERDLLTWLQTQKRVEWDELLSRYSGHVRLIHDWLQRGWITLEREMKDRVTKKKEQLVCCSLSADELERAEAEMTARAVKQRAVLRFFRKRKTPPLETSGEEAAQEIFLKEVLRETGASRATLKTMAEKGWLDIPGD